MGQLDKLIKLNKQLRKFYKKTNDKMVSALVELTDCMIFCGYTDVYFGYDRLVIEVNCDSIHILDRETGEILLLLGPPGCVTFYRELNLIELRDELKYHPVGDNLTAALSVLLSSMIEAGPGNISLSYKNIGINILDELIEVIDLKKSVAIFSLEAF